MALSAKAIVGGVTFHGGTGWWLPSILPQIDVYQRTGQPGSGSQVTGTRSEPQQVSAWFGCSSEAEAEAKGVAIEALCGQVVAVTDPYGRTFARVRVFPVSVMPPRAGKGTTITGTTAMTHLVSATFGLEVLP